MGRGKRDVSRTRRILLKILAGTLYKQIAFEENLSIPNICAIKARYIDETVTLKLNSLGLQLMSEEQLSLPLSKVETRRQVNNSRLRKLRDQSGRVKKKKYVNRRYRI